MRIANKKQQKQDRKKFNKDIGPATRLLIVRRQITLFMVLMLMEIGLGSLCWAIRNQEKNVKGDYMTALKNVYDPRSFTNVDSFLETFCAWALMLMAAGLSVVHKKHDEDIARQILSDIERAFPSMRILSSLNGKDYDKYGVHSTFHPVACRVIRHRASHDPRLLNGLINGHLSAGPTRDYAMAVICGHLKSHPEDFSKILNKYEEESLPRSLVRKYGTKTR